MEIGPAFPSCAQSLVAVEPREAAFDHPAVLAQPGTVSDSAAGDVSSPGFLEAE